MTQPHYVGFMGGLVIACELVRACIDAGILVKPASSDPPYGYWAWYKAPRLMKSWSRGR